MKTVCSLISPVVAFKKRSPDEDRGRVGHVLFLHSSTVNFGGGRRSGSSRVELELEAQLPGEVLDGADVVERLGQALVEEPLERTGVGWR